MLSCREITYLSRPAIRHISHPIMAMHLIKDHYVIHPGLCHHPHSLVMRQLHLSSRVRETEPRLIFDRGIPGVLLCYLLPHLIVGQLPHWQSLACR